MYVECRLHPRPTMAIWPYWTGPGLGLFDEDHGVITSRPIAMIIARSPPLLCLIAQPSAGPAAIE